MKLKIIVWIIVTGALLSACSDWLNVQPKVSVNEEKLFSREVGFKEALTGLYMQLADQDMYGRTLTYGFIDRLALRYNDHENLNLYTFPWADNEGYLNSIWSRSYNIMANINNFLSWLERRPEVLKTEGYLEIMKGEALGLRAFVSFDLLRMWGPVYKNDPSSPSIPYRTLFNREDKTLTPASEVLGYIEQDLKQAEQLLAHDPMHIEFPDNETVISGDPFLHYRLKRMNLYAVKALLARMYLWKGDKINADAYAREVIEAVNENNEQRFNLVTDNSTDRIYSTEILFSLSMNKFDEQISSDFAVSSGFSVENQDRVYRMFNTAEDGTNDVRIREGQGFAFAAMSSYCLKFTQRGLFSFVIKNTMPLIRLPEMYYIRCECESDLVKATDWLSQVRVARGADELLPFRSEEEKIDKLEIEYRKEFYGEGQLWFFLKRQFRKTFLDCPLEEGMADENYRFSIPEDEEILGTID